MGETFLQAGVLFTLIALGALLRATGALKGSDFKVLSTVALNVTIPAALFWGTRTLQMTRSSLSIVALGLGLNLFLLGIAHLLSRGKSPLERAFTAFNLPGYNVGCFSLPFVQSLLSPAAIATACLFDSGNAIMCCGVTYALGSAYLGVKGRENFFLSFLKRVFSSVPFCVYTFIFFMRGTGLQLPEFFWRVVSLIAPANIFLAMFLLGVGLNLRLDRSKAKAFAAHLFWRTALTLVTVALGAWLLPFEGEQKLALLLMMLSPATIMGAAFTARVGGDSELASTYNSASTLISLCTMTALVLFWR